MSHWFFFALAAFNVWLYVDTTAAPHLWAAAFLAIYGSSERVLNYLKKEKSCACSAP